MGKREADPRMSTHRRATGSPVFVAISTNSPIRPAVLQNNSREEKTNADGEWLRETE